MALIRQDLAFLRLQNRLIQWSGHSNPWRCVAPNRIAEQRAVLSRYPAIALELLPQLLPVPGHTPGHDEGQPAGLPGHTGCGAQQPLPEAAQTPALTGGLLHDAATGMQHLVGQQMHQQQGFVVAVDPGGRQRRGTIRITPWARAGRQRWIEHIHQFAEVSFGLAALAILRQQVLTGTAALGDVGYQPEVMQEQLTGLLEHHQHDPPGSIPTAGLVAMFMAPDTRLLGRPAGRLRWGAAIALSTALLRIRAIYSTPRASRPDSVWPSGKPASKRTMTRSARRARQRSTWARMKSRPPSAVPTWPGRRTASSKSPVSAQLAISG